MKKLWLMLAAILVVVANTTALVEVSKNRSGPPFQTIELTERELPLQSMGQDNSGVGLMLRWTRGTSSQPTQFPREKLEEIGFDLRIPPEAKAREVAPLPRAAFAVLEYDGDTYQEWEQNRKTGQSAAGTENRESFPLSVSRLFPVDFGKDPIALRQKYPEQGRYVVMQAVIGVRIEDPVPGGKDSSLKCTGVVTQIMPFYINVPLPYSHVLAPLGPQSGQPPRYSVTLNFGANLEPWVTSVKLNR